MQAFCAALRRFPAPFRVAVFIALFIAAAAPLVLPVYLFEYRATAGRSIIWAPVCLSGIFLPVLWSWMRWVHKLRAPLRTLGVGGRWWWKLWGVAFLAGTASVAVLCLMQLIFGWSRWGTAEPAKMVQTVLEGFGVALLVGGAEELLFRGWLLYELEQDYSLALALWLNAILFAVAHYLRPIAAIVETWPQFLGLLLLGLTLVWARRIPVLARPPKTTLWLAVGLHSGLVWAYYVVDVRDLIIPTGTVPEWVTGIGGNPLAGIVGITLLAAIALLTYSASRSAE